MDLSQTSHTNGFRVEVHKQLINGFAHIRLEHGVHCFVRRRLTLILQAGEHHKLMKFLVVSKTHGLMVLVHSFGSTIMDAICCPSLINMPRKRFERKFRELQQTIFRHLRLRAKLSIVLLRFVCGIQNTPQTARFQMHKILKT